MTSVLDIAGRRVTTFYGLKEIAKDHNYTEIRASNNELSSFEHFGTNPALIKLDVEQNQISSFAGMTRQKSLEELRIAGNPVAHHPQCRVMALLTIGFSLRTVDGVPIESSERELARRLGPSAALAVSYGWLLDDLRPKPSEEYDAVIVELRKAKKLRIVDSARVCSIPMVLAEQNVVGNRDFYEHDPRQSKAMADTIELQNKALLHFSKRVTQLEFQVAELQATLQRERDQKRRLMQAESQSTVESRLQRRGEQVIGLSATEIVSTVDCVTFPHVSLQTNVPLGPMMPSTTMRCVLQVSQTMLTILHFFTRSRIVECRMADIVRATFDPPTKSAVLQLRGGCILDVQCDVELTIAALHKLLYIAIGEPTVPSLLPHLSTEAQEQSRVQYAAASSSSRTISDPESGAVSKLPEPVRGVPPAVTSALSSSLPPSSLAPPQQPAVDLQRPNAVVGSVSNPTATTTLSSDAGPPITSSTMAPPPPAPSTKSPSPVPSAALSPPSTATSPSNLPLPAKQSTQQPSASSLPPPPPSEPARAVNAASAGTPSETTPSLMAAAAAPASSLQDRTTATKSANSSSSSSSSSDNSDNDVTAMLPAARKTAPLLPRATVRKSVPPPIPKRAGSSERNVSSSSDGEKQQSQQQQPAAAASSSPSPPPPPPKRTLWRGKEIQELLIASSDSDSD